MKKNKLTSYWQKDKSYNKLNKKNSVAHGKKQKLFFK
jgi:hypothetical protein